MYIRRVPAGSFPIQAALWTLISNRSSSIKCTICNDCLQLHCRYTAKHEQLAMLYNENSIEQCCDSDSTILFSKCEQQMFNPVIIQAWFLCCLIIQLPRLHCSVFSFQIFHVITLFMTSSLTSTVAKPQKDWLLKRHFFLQLNLLHNRRSSTLF